jgi:dTMP kinase
MGRLIVLEGIDGSGKSTQFKLLCDRFSRENRDFMRLRFPRYNEPSSALIRMYLGGEFGNDPDAVNAYAASTFFAVDRFASYMLDWRKYYNDGGLILTDRYTTSNAIHQGAKLPFEQRRHFFKWLYDYEFTLMGLPAPDLVIYMDIDADSAGRRLSRRQTETGAAGDIHENDAVFLDQCAKCGVEAAEYYNWKSIACLSENRERSEEEIHREIYGLVECCL